MAGKEKIQALFRLFRIYGKLDLMWALRDSKYFLVQMIADLISVAASVSGMLLLAARYQGLGGMNDHSLLFMMGYATMVNGIYLCFFGANNTGQISRIIGRGQLDHCMLQPVPLWIQLMTQGFAPFSGSMTLLAGGGMVIYGAKSMGPIVTWQWGLCLVLCLLCSTTVLVGSIYLISSLAFLAPAAAEEIASRALSLFTSTWSFPLGGLTSMWKALLCTVIPIGISAWLPSMVLTQSLPEGQTPPALFFISAVAAALLITTIRVFRKGLKHYAKNGCPRYVGLGHR